MVPASWWQPHLPPCLAKVRTEASHPTPARGLLVLGRASPAWGLQSCAGLGLSPHVHSLARQDSGCKTDPSLASSAHLPLPAAHLPPRVWATVPQCTFCWRSWWQSLAPPLSPHAGHTSQPLGWATTTITAGPDFCGLGDSVSPVRGSYSGTFNPGPAACLPMGSAPFPSCWRLPFPGIRGESPTQTCFPVRPLANVCAAVASRVSSQESSPCSGGPPAPSVGSGPAFPGQAQQEGSRQLILGPLQQGEANSEWEVPVCWVRSCCRYRECTITPPRHDHRLLRWSLYRAPGPARGTLRAPSRLTSQHPMMNGCHCPHLTEKECDTQGQVPAAS